MSALDAAAAAAPVLAAQPPRERASWLVAAAGALLVAADDLVPLAVEETGLTEPRLRGEIKRTAVQLKLFAEVAAAGEFLDVRLDAADPDFVLGPRPDLRRYLVPLGPVLNFAASNFPFAFSVAGGDTASALAAGCPVVVKAHPGHPRLSDRTAEVLNTALPAGALGVIHGQDEGVAALQDERITAAAFTGSLAGGQALAAIAAARPRPIPFYGELGSLNPVVVTPEALTERAAAIASGFAASVSGSAGQLCTKPGLLFVPSGPAFPASFDAVGPHKLLHPGIVDGYTRRRSEVLGTPGVTVLVEGAVTDDGATPTLVETDLATLLEHRDTLLQEAFGPLSIVVRYTPGEPLGAVLAEVVEGSLTAGVHVAAGEDSPWLHSLVTSLQTLAGRVLFNGWPTGVAVTPAMQHGGPFPAATNPTTTSVGTAAITRFLRPVVYQDAPAALLPEPLRDDNPWHVPQHRSPAGESPSWGSLAG
ncbi:aldehyde dehydrogenase [Paractinoplanes abujensis]|uniref:NADP-dependent aldehyde dehydrogenase n=1 Tax=Paractinoplanes abujensis TaxID=882441 RepID=A0A7W7CSL3_9ACTN|nr:aldehyde dehydrogenase family protein [Actinoplanes abujensis]MBB4693928.1 NADP-dependent aldehyde dehydrogenase [Actinoplanes abujensis]GID21416.1 aldehyde dehydrogenase [Actinoplanes abujensis]